MSYISRLNLYAKWFGFFKVPLVFFVNPKIIHFDEHKIVTRIRLRRRTKNHLNSMYFGALAIGADFTGGILGMAIAQQKNQRISLVFKSVSGEFIRRPESDVLFTCEDAELVNKMIEDSRISGERINCDINIIATCPDKFDQEPLAIFRLTLSIKSI